MNDEFLNLKDQQVLHEIKDYLENISVAGTVMEASADLPFNILVAVTSDQVSVNIMFLPLPEDQFEEIRLLQFYSLLIPAVEVSKVTDLITLLNTVNSQSPFGSFFINDANELAYKYIFPVSRFGLPSEGLVHDIFNIYNGSLTKFKGLIGDVNTGKTSLQDALRDASAE